MPKNTQDSLHRLIKRMSKSEKRYFRLMTERQQSGDGKFIRLYEKLEKMKKYDADKLIGSRTGISRVQLPNQKAFLYRYLLGCLRRASSSIDLSIARMIGDAHILYDKCLYEDCIHAIDKAKQFARENDRTAFLFDLFDLEKLVTQRTISSDHEERVKLSNKLSREALEQLTLENRFRNVSARLNVFYIKTGFIRNSTDEKEIRKVFQREFPSINEKFLGAAARIHRYNALTSFHFFVQDFRAGYRTAEKWVELFEHDPDLVKVHTEMYIHAVNSLLVVQNKFGMLREFERTQRKLVLLKKNRHIRWSANLGLNLFKCIYVHEINRHFMKGEFRAGIRIVSKLESELEKFIPLLDHQSLLIFYYKIACLYFGSDQYKQALHWLNRIINEKDISVREDLHTFARILALICHNELGNERLTSAHTIALYRFMLRKGDLSRYNKFIIAFLRKLQGGLSERQLRVMYSDLRSKLQPLTTDRYEKRAFLYFDIITWLESKITGKNMESIVKSKRRLLN